MITYYVAGLLFNEDFSQVALINKLRPEAQKGKWNAIGGKVNDNETLLQAMTREFCEEAGYYETEWKLVCVLKAKDKYYVNFFYTTGDLTKLRTMTDEQVDLFTIHDINEYSLVPGLPTVIGLVLDRNEIELGFDLVLNVKSHE